MKSYLSMSKDELKSELSELTQIYDGFKSKGLKLDMSRGKPGADQLELSVHILDIVNSASECKTEDGIDCRNYGLLEGLPSIRRLFGELMGVDASSVFVGGNSSLSLMFDTVSCFMTAGLNGCKPWMLQEKVKFLCPVPGYDRHFSITQYYNIEMINIPMTSEGPDMDMVESLVSSDESIKGIWCVPKYSNPQGITYSDETVRRFARIKPAAKDFRILWDNAYCIHDISDTPETLLNLMAECKKNGTEDLPVIFCSTSKITFPGSGVAALAASASNMQVLKKRYTYQTIGHDKINMLRHMLFFKDVDGIAAHMNKHKEILAPKFKAVVNRLESELGGRGIASWLDPNGGYFVSVDVLDGCAKRAVALCKEAGVVMTDAGATYPYGSDPKDSNIRIAPTFPPVSELNTAMELFCISVRLAAAERLLAE